MIASPGRLQELLKQHFGLDLDFGSTLACPGLDWSA
jgi:hypothetical protein